MRHMKAWKMVREPEYNQIKQLCDMGIKFGKIMLLTGRTWPTVEGIKKSKSWKTYHKAYVPKKEPSKPNGISLNNPDKQDYTLAFLERIATALELMEGHWRTKSGNYSLKFGDTTSA